MGPPTTWDPNIRTIHPMLALRVPRTPLKGLGAHIRGLYCSVRIFIVMGVVWSAIHTSLQLKVSYIKTRIRMSIHEPPRHGYDGRGFLISEDKDYTKLPKNWKAED